MSRQRERFKEMHPEQFSDSQIVKKGQLDRAFLDFYLDSLTSRNMERQFEQFCRHIAENEICPNLLPQTGPTGGGDSKVDSETYPVSEYLSELWVSGDESGLASTERWAFAFSAKKAWKPKLKSDVEKISKVEQETHRGYKKIFFMSNQFISDKQRAEKEDELRKEYGLDVRILDRTWFLDKIFSAQNNIDITVHDLELSESFINEVHVGEKDFKRKEQLNIIEERLRNTEIKFSEKVKLVQKAVILGRELEFSEDQEKGLINRSIRVSKKYGNKVDLANAYYDAAWTIYWWYTDLNNYYEYYKEYEKIAIEEKNVNLFSHWITLWINLYVLSMENEGVIQIECHTEKIKAKYLEYIEDVAKPNTMLEARTAYLYVRLLMKENVNDIAIDMMHILDKSIGNIDLNVYPLRRIIQEFLPIEKADCYDELFEKMISVMSRQEQNTERSIMLAQRGHSLREEKPYEALTYFSRTLIDFYNEKNKDYLISVVFEMAEIFEKIGLYWASRNFYYFDFCLCLNQYMKFGYVSPVLFLSAHALKYMELRLGHILYAVEFDFLEKIALECYPEEINETEDQESHFDGILAIQFLRTEFCEINNLEQLPEYLKQRNLFFSEIAIKYMLGYYDEDFLESSNGNKNTLDDMMRQLREQPAFEEMKGQPWYGYEDTCKMHSKVLGCDIETRTYHSFEHGEIEIAATILATIESFLGTGIKNNLISMCGKIDIDILYKDNLEHFIAMERISNQNRHIDVVFSEYDSDCIIEAQNEFAIFSTKIISVIISMMFPYKEAIDKLENMIKNEAVLNRVYAFSNSIFFGMETLGKEMFSFTYVLGNYNELKCCRIKPPFEKSEKVKEEKNSGAKIMFQEPPEGIDFDSISNEDIYTDSLINASLWDNSGWRGIMFMADIYGHSCPPILSFIFEKDSGKQIFAEWKEQYGEIDGNDKIAIRIIKNIDKKHLFWYRVIVGVSNPVVASNTKLFAFPARIHTMMPADNRNLLMFETELENLGVYKICPCVWHDKGKNPNICQELAIQKNKSSIVICDAWEVPENDILFFSGVFPTDSPTIPKGKEDAPILKMIERKKQIADKHKNL